MADFYGRMQGTASRLLKQYGATVDVRRAGGVTRVNGNEVVQPDVTFKITGVRKDYNPYNIDGKLIMAGDVQFVATSEVEMRIGDMVTLDGREWRVEKPNPQKPATLNLAYKLQLRAG